MKNFKRPQGMNAEENIYWVMNNELEQEPEDYELDCWIAKDSRCVGKDFRPVYYWEGRSRLMYHVLWENWYEKDFPKKLHARHTCEDPRCINPLHIVPGTPQENEADKTIKVNKKSLLPPTPSNLTNIEKINWWLEFHCKDFEGCKIWLGATGSDGYAQRNILVNGVKKKHMVHRFVYSVIHNEKYSGDWIARHTCNNKNCINPKHIIKGSREENSLDCRSYSKATKLKEDDVRYIIEEFLKKEFTTQKSFSEPLAKKFNVSIFAITNIVFRRRNWKDILAEYSL